MIVQYIYSPLRYFLFYRSIITIYAAFVITVSILDLNLWNHDERDIHSSDSNNPSTFTNTNQTNETRNQSYTVEVLKCFSIQRHYKTIANQDAFDENYKFLYGFRFLSFLWILYAHTYIYQHILSVGNTIKLRKVPQQFAFQIFMNGTLAAETFFFMSGICSHFDLI